ncbi:MAG: L-threonine 3-dehydrogenase [Clostridia bacterium]|nr:L-threonine 3-dehydrogenase [Clostridia bacterium]
MDAIVKPARQKGLELVRKEVPKINFGEALVKIRYTAICGTDVHIYDWNDWAQDTIVPPLTVGHEFVGEIVEIKGGDDSFKVGDLVSAEGHIVCGKCRNCRAGRRHLCPNTKGLGVNRDGIFAEYAAIPISNLWLCDKDIPEKYYAIFDPLGNATHTALKFGLVGEDVLITGAGPIGIMAAAIARHVGAKNVVITDINDDRLALAKEVCGKTITTVNTLATSLGEVQRSLGMREGFDVGLEMSGSGAALSDMIDNMIMGGKIALLGIQGKNAPVDWNKIIFNMLTLQGIYGREVFETWHKMTAMLKSGLDISKIITHEIKYEDFESGFAAMHGGKAGKVIMDWTK